MLTTGGMCKCMRVAMAGPGENVGHMHAHASERHVAVVASVDGLTSRVELDPVYTLHKRPSLNNLLPISVGAPPFREPLVPCWPHQGSCHKPNQRGGRRRA
jgi:hypothetical protein